MLGLPESRGYAPGRSGASLPGAADRGEAGVGPVAGAPDSSARRVAWCDGPRLRSPPGSTATPKRFARYVLELARHMTMSDVAHHLGLGWDLVKRLLKEDLKRRFGRIRLKDLRFLAIDEISIGRGSVGASSPRS